jgi:hypothetical protein
MLIVFLLVSSLWARNYTNSQIADNYIEGEYLIYDCAQKHWVCAAQSGQQRCNQQREVAKENNKGTWPCVVVNKYNQTKSCHQFLQQITDDPVYSSFCHRFDFRHKLTKY